MNSLVAADLHLTDNVLDEYRFKIFDILKQIVLKHGIKVIKILGDITEKKDKHSSDLVNRISDEIAKLSQVVDKIIILKGNHDYKDEGVAFFSMLKYLPKVSFITVPNTIEVKDCVFIPHIRDEEVLIKAITSTVTDTTKFIFMHQSIGEIRLQHTSLMGNMKVWEIISKLHCKVISGDIHVPQQHRNLIFVGSPYPVYFGDTQKGRVLWLKGNEILAIETPSISRHTLSINNYKELQEIKLLEGDQVKIDFILSDNDVTRYKQEKILIEDYLSQKKVQLVELVPIFGIKTTKTSSTSVKGKDLNTYFKEFCSKNNLTAQYCDIGHEILNK